MKKMNKKLISLLLSVIMVFGTLAVGLTAFADGYTQYNDVYHLNTETNRFEKHVYGAFDTATETATCTFCGYAHSCRMNGHVDENEDCSCDLCGEDSHIDKNPQDHACDRCGEDTHTWILLNHQDADCTSGDFYTYYCATCGFNPDGFNSDEDGNPLQAVTYEGDNVIVEGDVIKDSSGKAYKTIKIIDGHTLALGHYFDFAPDKVDIQWNGLDSQSSSPYVYATGTFTCARCGTEVSVRVENLEETSSGKIDLLEDLAGPPCQPGSVQYEATFNVPEGGESNRIKVYKDVRTSSYVISNHVPGTPVEENRVEPTCEEDGSYDTVVYCTVCSEEISRETTYIPATGHNAGVPEEIDVPMTTGADGYHQTIVRCTVCDEIISEETVIYHDYRKLSTTQPSCTSGGYDTYRCRNCGDQYDEYTSAELGHYWYDDSNSVNPQYVTFSNDENFNSCTMTFRCRRPECGQTLSYTVYQEPNSIGKISPVGYVPPSCEAGSGQAYVAEFKIVCPDSTSGHAEVDASGKETFTHEIVIPDGNLEALGHIYEDEYYKQGGAGYQPNGDASCTEDGTRTAPCDRCGKISSTVPDEGSALGHTFADPEIITPATCTEEGLQRGVCTRCGEYTDEIIPALGHISVGAEAVSADPTCTEEGYTGYICPRCNEVVKITTVPALGHTPEDQTVEENRVEPTCSDAGSYDVVTYCSVCGEEISRETIEIPATGEHEYNALGFCRVCGAHDCAGRGHSFIGGFEADANYHWKVCSYCGKIDSDGIQETIKDDEGNILEKYHIDEEKGEHKDTNQDEMCDVCGYAAGHQWQIISHTDPSCVDTGKDVYKCSVHESEDETKEVIIPALGHYWFDDHTFSADEREYVDFVFADNYESCTLTIKCRRTGCSESISYTVYTNPSDKGAVLANPTTNKAIAKRTAATCEAGAGISYYAIFTISAAWSEFGFDSGALETVNDLIASDSDLSDIVNANGLNPKINRDEQALICILTREESDPLGHIYEDEYYKKDGAGYQPNGDASCTEDGTRTAPCDRCGKVSSTVPDEGSATGHTFADPEIINPATCTEEGLQRGICTRCGEYTDEVIPKLNHVSEGATRVSADPTCDEEGYEGYICVNCGEVVKETTVPALGHIWSDWKTSKSATCTEYGEETRSCERCGLTQTRTGDMPKGHDYYYMVDASDGSYHIGTCINCGETIGKRQAHVDGDYDFLCDKCGVELNFWEHWLHYLVGLPSYGFGNFTTAFMRFISKIVNLFTGHMINF